MNIKYGIIDTGNIGPYIGACAIERGLDMHMFLGESLITEINVCSSEGDFVVSNPKIYVDIKAMPRCDVCFVNINTLLEMKVSMMELKNILSSNGILVLFQKGVNVYEVMDFYPEITVIGGLSWLKPSKTSSNTVQHDFGKLIEVGFYNVNFNNEDLMKIKLNLIKPFENSRIQFSFIENYWSKNWTRLAFNLPYFVFATLYDRYSQQIFTDSKLVELAKEVRTEVIAVANAVGIKIDENMVEGMDKKLHSAPWSYPGLKQDYDNNNPFCLDDIFSELLICSDKNNLSIPVIISSYHQLKILESRNNS